jgi:hypothetical protein
MNMIEKAVKDIEKAEQALVAARALKMKCERDLRTARSKIAAQIVGWQAQFKPIDHSTLARQEIAVSQQYKADVKAGRVKPSEAPRKAASVIDQMNTRGSDPNRSYGPGYRRGALPSHMYGRAVPVKLPSAR